jgi:hypothetical protein
MTLAVTLSGLACLAGCTDVRTQSAAFTARVLVLEPIDGP